LDRACFEGLTVHLALAFLGHLLSWFFSRFGVQENGAGLGLQEVFALRELEKATWLEPVDALRRKSLPTPRFVPDTGDPFHYIDALRTARGGVARYDNDRGDT